MNIGRKNRLYAGLYAWRTATAAAVACLILVAAIPASAASYFFVTFHYPPLAYEDGHGVARGASVRIVSRIMGRLGHECRIQVLPWTRALDMVRKGAADAIFTAYKNRERERFLLYSGEVLFPQAVYFYRKKGTDIRFDGDLEALIGLRIGVLSTISYGDRFDRFKHRLRLDKANKLAHNFEKLDLGRVDLVPSHIIVGDRVLEKMGLDRAIERMPVQLASVPSYIAFSRKKAHGDLIRDFDRELIRLKHQGAYADILKEFGM